ncbi:hypothetical protein HDU92_004743 [Lobulomyces angularis]|nr:hypothetical protein HDU92_004743 [Lobulomyces angularis]
MSRSSPQNIATAADAKKLPTTTPDEHADMTDIIDDPKLVEKDIFKTEKLAISTVKKHLVVFLKIFWKNVCECFSNEDQSEFIEIPNPNTSEDETMVMLRIMILHELEKLSNTIRRRFYFEAVKNLQENLYKLFNFETTGCFFRTSLMDFDKTSLCLYCKFGSNEKWVYTKPPINTENSFPSGFLI